MKSQVNILYHMYLSEKLLLIEISSSLQPKKGLSDSFQNNFILSHKKIHHHRLVVDNGDG